MPLDGLADALYVGVRIPKSGSVSLTRILRDGFAGRRTFYLPDTLQLDTAFSRFQCYRAVRSRAQNLWRHYRTFDIAKAFAVIAREAEEGDLIDGGHIDFATVASNLPRPVKMITILREPAARVQSEYRYGRQGYFKKPLLNRYDAGVRPKAAARYSFSGYLDFLIEHRDIYADLASRYVGWDGQEDLAAFFARNVFHAGVVEEPARFAQGLSQKLDRHLSFPHENRTTMAADTAIGAAERAKIERLYAQDHALHAWIREHG